MPYQKDPIESAEEIVRRMHDKAGSYTQPVLRKYPLLFAFLLTFSVAATMEGFEGMIKHVPLFEEYPVILMLLGIIALFLTGTLYKILQKEH